MPSLPRKSQPSFNGMKFATLKQARRICGVNFRSWKQVYAWLQAQLIPIPDE